jgi:hypothetical protein
MATIRKLNGEGETMAQVADRLVRRHSGIVPATDVADEAAEFIFTKTDDEDIMPETYDRAADMLFELVD